MGFQDFVRQSRQSLAENVAGVISITVSALVAFVLGYVEQKLLYTFYVVGAGLTLTFLSTLTPWPIYRKYQIQWQKVKERGKKTEKESVETSDGHNLKKEEEKFSNSPPEELLKDFKVLCERHSSNPELMEVCDELMNSVSQLVAENRILKKSFSREGELFQKLIEERNKYLKDDYQRLLEYRKLCKEIGAINAEIRCDELSIEYLEKEIETMNVELIAAKKFYYYNEQ